MDDAAQEQASHRNMDHGFRDIEALLFNCIEKAPTRKVSVKRRQDSVVATAANDCWSMNFLSDQLFDERKIRALTAKTTSAGSRRDRRKAERPRRRRGDDVRADRIAHRFRSLDKASSTGSWTPLESGGILCGHRSKFMGKVSLCPDKAHN